jgi:AcrR family transcriptional regulator
MTSIPRKRDPDAKLAALHKSAFTLLAKQGYQDVPVSLIAEHAGVAVGTFYRFYPTKMALLEAMSDALEAEFVMAMRRAWSESERYPDKLSSLSSAVFDTIAAHRKEIGVMQMTAGHRSLQSNPLGDAIRTEIARLYADGIQNGDFEAHDPLSFAAAAHGIVEGLMRQYLIEPTQAKQVHYAQMVASMLAKLVLR